VEALLLAESFAETVNLLLCLYSGVSLRGRRNLITVEVTSYND